MAVAWMSKSLEPAVKRIEELWYDGHSTAEIARIICSRYGLDINKNSIVSLRKRRQWIARPGCIRRQVGRPISSTPTPTIPTPVIRSLPPLPSLSPGNPVGGPIAIVDTPSWVPATPSKKKIAVVVCEVVAPQHEEAVIAPRVAKQLPVRRADGGGCLWIIGKTYCDHDLHRFNRPITGVSALSSYCAPHHAISYQARHH
jgi:hypothetical protein